MPNRKKAEENEPSRKYFMAASCESRRRRRASPHIRYSGSDSVSSATNIVRRYFGAGGAQQPAERGHAVRAVRDKQHGDGGEDQDRALDEQGRPVHGDRAHRGHVPGAAL